MDIVRQVLEQERRELEKFKSIEVLKHLEAKVDLGYLLCSDVNDLDETALKWAWIFFTKIHNQISEIVIQIQNIL